MTGPATRHRQGPYSGTAGRRLWRACAALAALALALGSAGCSLSYQMESAFDSSKPEVTGSITPADGKASELPPEADLAFTRAAVAEVLSRGGKDASQPWENPRSGARGTVTPIASAYTLDGRTCRDFLASYVNAKSESWLQGEACKLEKGAWQVRSLKPWKRS